MTTFRRLIRPTQGRSAITITVSRFGDVLRGWRETRRLSQLDLSASADVSQRHLSFLETGRSSPSREMVIHLATILDVPLRDRNAWLASAGFAPLYAERNLAEPALDQVRGVLEHILAAHDPFPAYVVDRRWDLMMTNQSAMTLTTLLIDPEDAADFGGNVARLSLHPKGLRRHLVNWNQFGAALLHRLEREVADRPSDSELGALLSEVRGYPGVAELPSRPELPTSQDLLVPLHLRTPDHDLRLFTTIATIGAPYDITLEELRLETLLPADPETEQVLHQLVIDR